MSVIIPGGGMYRGNGKYRYTKMSEINVTPFVDVMLVLLIVFMVTAPLLTVGVPVDLPKTRAATITDTQETLVVTIDAAGARSRWRSSYRGWSRSPARIRSFVSSSAAMHRSPTVRS